MYSLHKLVRLLIVASIILTLTAMLYPPTTAFATDCNTNCDKSCKTRFGVVDPLCRQRCLAEKKIACQTGILTCDLWKTYPNFYPAVLSIEAANQEGWVKDVHACHAAVDNGDTAATGLGIAYKLAQESAKSNPYATVVQMAAVHFLHCACNEASFVVPASVGQYDRIHLKNQCTRPIYAAMHYKDINSGWVTKGWWELAPGEDAYVADTKNSIFYVYAESTDPRESRLYWSGEDYYATIGQDTEQYGFIEKKITTTEWGTWTQSFSCN